MKTHTQLPGPGAGRPAASRTVSTTCFTYPSETWGTPPAPGGFPVSQAQRPRSPAGPALVVAHVIEGDRKEPGAKRSLDLERVQPAKDLPVYGRPPGRVGSKNRVEFVGAPTPGVEAQLWEARTGCRGFLFGSRRLAPKDRVPPALPGSGRFHPALVCVV